MSALTLLAEQKASEDEFDGRYANAKLLRQLVAEIKQVEKQRDEAIIRLTNAALDMTRGRR